MWVLRRHRSYETIRDILTFLVCLFLSFFFPTMWFREKSDNRLENLGPVCLVENESILIRGRKQNQRKMLLLT